MSNPRTRATRNESEGFLGYELLGMSQERGSCDGLWVIRENKRKENDLECNMTPFPRELLLRNSVAVTIPLLTKISHCYFYLILQGGNGSRSTSLTDIGVVESNHAPPGFAGSMRCWAVVM